MSHAEVVHSLQPAAGATAALVAFIDGLRYSALDAEVRHYARRHLLDTFGVMICGAAGEIATRAERTLAGVRGPGSIPVPGRARRADLLDAAFLGGTAAHGIELDDGYRQGSVHPGCAVVPAVLSAGYARGASGTQVIEAIVAGYETSVAIARACHPDLRQRGFHPTGACTVFGAAASIARRLHGLARPGDRRCARHRREQRRRPGSPSSTAVTTSMGCTPATRHARVCKPRCWRRRGCRDRRT